MRFPLFLFLQISYLIGFGIKGVLSVLYSGSLLPVYVNPGDNCEAWSPLVAGFPTNPPELYSNIQFYLVINPSNGPGAPGSQPGASWQNCIAHLRQLQQNGANIGGGKVEILGYVSTDGGKRKKSAVSQDIVTYAGWASAYRPDGVYFDGVKASKKLFGTYQNYSTQVRNLFNPNYIILNSGAPPQTDAYYDLADQIVTFDGAYADFHVDGSDLIITDTAPRNKQAVILHDSPNQDFNLLFNITWRLSAVIGVRSTFITDASAETAFQQFPGSYYSYLGDLVASQTA